jgi:hypothetical protein
MIAEAWKGTHSKHTVDVTVGEVEDARRCDAGSHTGRKRASPQCYLRQLVRKGSHFVNRRTREGAELAIQCFEHAAAECPGDAPTRAVDVLPDAGHVRHASSRRGVSEVSRTHEQAVAVGGLKAELRANHDQPAPVRATARSGRNRILAAISEKPSLGTGYMRAALLYVTMDRLDDAAAMLERCEVKDPLVPTLPATNVLLRFWQRDFDGDRLRQAGDRAALSADRAGQLRPGAQFSDGCRRHWLFPLASVMSRTCPAARPRGHLSREDGTDDQRAGHPRGWSTCDARYVDAFYQCVRRARPPRRAMNSSSARWTNSAFLYSMNVDPNGCLPQRRRYQRLEAGRSFKSPEPESGRLHRVVKPSSVSSQV